MFDWLLDIYHYIGWIVYAGMLVLISSIYNTLLSVPNELTEVLNNSEVNNLFYFSIGVFFAFVGIMLTILALSRLLDWETSKVLSQLKKIFMLCMLVLVLPFMFNQFAMVTDNLLNSHESNAMIAIEGQAESAHQSVDLGVVIANIFLHVNEDCVSCQEDPDISEAKPIKKIGDIYDQEIINMRGEDETGEDVYVYKYMNSIIGIIFCLGIVVLLVLTTFKIYGYLFNIIVLKIWLPIKMIYDGFNDIPISDSIYEIVAAFMSFLIQLIIIPFSVVMVGIMNDVSDNIFLQLSSLTVGLWFMFTGVDYIQSKFQTSSGVPSTSQTKQMVTSVFNSSDNLRDNLASIISSESNNVSILKNLDNNQSNFNNNGKLSDVCNFEEQIDSNLRLNDLDSNNYPDDILDKKSVSNNSQVDEFVSLQDVREQVDDIEIEKKIKNTEVSNQYIEEDIIDFEQFAALIEEETDDRASE